MVRRPRNQDSVELDLHPISGGQTRDLRRQTPPVLLRDRVGPWLVIGVVLVLIGVVLAPGPPQEQRRIIDHAGQPELQWEVDVEFDGQPDEQGIFERDPDHVWAVSGRTGQQVWEWPHHGHHPPRPLARVDDVLVITTLTTLVGADLRTGETLWARQALHGLPEYSDGQVLVFLEPGEQGLAFVGIEVATGAEVLTVDAGPGPRHLSVVEENQMLLLTDSGLALWQLG